jgi:hypothetical protein
MNSLKLRISRAGESYAVDLFRLIENKWRKIKSEPQVVLDFDPKGVHEFVLGQAGASPRFQEMRKRVGAFLLPDRVHRVWEQHGASRTYLEVVPPELAMVPWEIAHRGSDLSLDPERTIVRAHRLKLSPSIDEVWPVRLLIVLGSTDAAIAAEDEAKAIWEALRCIDQTFHLKELRLPARPELAACLKDFRPHILHFIGHADERNGTAQLRFSLPDGTTWPWTTDHIRNDLRAAGHALQFAYLNACRTFSAGAATRSEASAETLAQMLLRAGTGAVLAMQADVVGSTSGLCAATLYNEVGKGATLDRALALAQIAVSQKVPGATGTRESFMGALTVSRPPDQILAVRRSESETLKAVEQCTPLNEVINVFVDRLEQRTKLIQSFYPIRPEEVDPYSLTLVHGDSQAGKSWIAHWCMDACGRHKHQVRYIEIVRAYSNWLEVLRSIRDGDPQRKSLLIYRTLDPMAFGGFNWELNRRLEGIIELDPALAPPFEEDARKPLGDEFSEDMVTRTFTSFRDALQEVANPMPLLLVLDHFSSDRKALPAAHFRYLWENLISPIGAGLVKNVKMVVVLSKDEKERDYGNLANFERNYADVPIGGFPADQFSELGMELFSLLYPGTSPDAKPCAEGLLRLKQKHLKGEWSLAFLAEQCREINATLAKYTGGP